MHAEKNRDRDPLVETYTLGLDRTPSRENQKLTVEERFQKAMALQRFAEELRRAGDEMPSRPRGAPPGLPSRMASSETSSRATAPLPLHMPK